MAVIEGQARRATVNPTEAAKLLGIKADSVRQNLRRGVLDGFQDEGGQWRVYLDSIQASLAGGREGATRQGHVQQVGQLAEIRERLARAEATLAAVLDERDHLRDELKDQRATFARELADARASWDEWLSYMNARMAQQALPAPEGDQPAQDQGKRRPGLLGRLLGR